MSERIGLVGSGGQADEAEACFDGHVDFRAVSARYVTDGLVDVANPTKEQGHTAVVAAVGAPGLRRQMIEEWPGSEYGTIIALSADIDKSATIGRGSIVSKNAVITTDVKIGEHVIINVAASVQHGSTIGDYSTVGPGVRIGGGVHIGKGVFIGIGAIIANGASIADGVVIGAGAVVLPRASLDAESGVYIGAPVTLKRTNKDWLYEI